MESAFVATAESIRGYLIQVSATSGSFVATAKSIRGYLTVV
jgi:hypothetical protein